jgi:hypothetical protein
MNKNIIISISLLMLITSFQAFSFQNVEELLANPDITWVGEVYTDYLPNITITNPENEKIKNRHETIDYNTFEVLKIKNKILADQLNPAPNLLSDKILQLNSSNLEIYKDDALTEKLSYKAYQEIINQEIFETKIFMEPETYREIVEVVKSKLNASNVEQFRLKQILSYNAKTNQLNISPIAIAPLQSINEFVSRQEKVLFWMPIKEAFETINLDNASINWAKRFDKGIFTDSIKTLKGTKNLSDIFIEMIVEYKSNSSTTKMYQIEGNYRQLVVLKPETVAKLGEHKDTVVSISPVTYEEIIQIVEYDFGAKDLKKIRITQDWVWDDKTQAMQIRVLAFSPIAYMPDYNGNYRYTPYYYIKARE